eukprot:365661-Chlamydomonas_euryale.AAC.12
MLPDIQRASDDADVLATSKRVFAFAPTRNWEEKEMDVLCEPAFSTARPHYVNDAECAEWNPHRMPRAVPFSSPTPSLPAILINKSTKYPT